MSNLGTESVTVQNPLIAYARDAGWKSVPAAEALSLRKGEGGLLFRRVLTEQLIALNPELVTEGNVDEVIRKIESVRNSIEGNQEILKWLRNWRTIFDPAESRERNVTVIDYANPDRNIFQVTDEWQYTNGRETSRADVVFLINGIPVAIVEAKSATKEKGVELGLIQIREYHHETPEMMTLPQVFDITHLIDFFYGVTWNLERKNLFNWKHEEKGNFEQKVRRFFDRARFLLMLKDWILFFVKDDELRKTVLCQHQTRAVEKIVARCADPARQTGLVWHTQGSGKTFTMIAAAQQVLAMKDVFGKPTVILMIDRNELEGQLHGWVERILAEMGSHDIALELATSKKRLRELLTSDFRGLIVTMIHKFDGIPKSISTRDNIFIFVDEAHRSVGGDLGNYLVGALPNATLLGFTGTPVDKTAYGKGTFKVFGKEDENGYLDKYSIAESIEDETTVRLKYALAPSEIRVPREQLEKEFLNLVEAEGVSDIDDLNRILDDALRLKTFLKSADRVRKVAAFVAKHFKENVEPLGYKAFLVGVDREACALYKQALDELLPPEYTVPVYTASQHDSERFPLVYKYQIASAEEDRVRKIFPKPKSLPKIFIVTDKLLTGFDAPILYCMYLDKPMRDHVLLQAIARVNRPYEISEDKKKPCGLVVDFVGIFEKLEKALAFDSDVVSGVIESLDLLMVRFRDLMQGPAREYLGLCKGRVDDKTVEKAIDTFAEHSKRESFYGLFKELETLYEILSPSPELRDFIEDFGCLSVLYAIIRNAYQKKAYLYGDVAQKTEALVRERVSTYGLQTTLPPVTIDDQTLKAIKDQKGSDNTKVVNLINSIATTVAEEQANAPYLKSIGERAEEIRELYDERQMTAKQVLDRLGVLVREVTEARESQNKSGFDADTFAIFWTLKQERVGEAMALAPTLSALFNRFPNYRENANEMRQIKAELYKALMPAIGKEKMVPLVNRLLRLRVS